MAAGMMAAILRRQSCDFVLRCGLHAATLSMRSHQAVPDSITGRCVAEDFVRHNIVVESKVLAS